MRPQHLLFALLLFVWTPSIAEDKSPTVKRAGSIAEYLSELKEYEKDAPSLDLTPSPFWGYRGGWKIGDGYLAVEANGRQGAIMGMRYVIGDEKNRTILKAKEVDLTKGEMTVIIPGTAADKTEPGPFFGR